MAYVTAANLKKKTSNKKMLIKLAVMPSFIASFLYFICIVSFEDGIDCNRHAESEEKR